MNVADNSPTIHVRMGRIQRISKHVRRILLWAVLLFFVVWFPLFLWMANHWDNSHGKWLQGLRFVVLFVADRYFGRTFWSVFDAHRLPFLVYAVLWIMVFFTWFWTLLKLFGFFERGILFTAETVRCVRILGGIYLLKFSLQLTLFLLIPFPDNQVLSMGTGGLFAGLLIIFIAWLIDEAHKIREEQELTV